MRLKILLTIIATLSMMLSAQTRIPMPVSQNPLFEVSTNEVTVEFAAPQMTIGGDVIVAGGSGTYSYRWCRGSEEISTEPVLTISEAGVYDLYISDAFDCMQHVVFTVQAASVEGVGLDKIALYPNPVTDCLTVSGLRLRQVCVVSMGGALVAVHGDFAPGTTTQIDLSSLPAGEYVVNCVTENNDVVTGKIVKK